MPFGIIAIAVVFDRRKTCKRAVLIPHRLRITVATIAVSSVGFPIVNVMNQGIKKIYELMLASKVQIEADLTNDIMVTRW
jgi:hypothetical protein